MELDLSNKPPAPGSDAAIAKGCTCPVLDNAHGRGYMGNPGLYVMTEGCPLHGTLAAKKEDEDGNREH